MDKKVNMSPEMERRWAVFEATREKAPARNRKGPRFVFTPQQIEIRRTAYLARYYARKLEKLTSQAPKEGR